MERFEVSSRLYSRPSMDVVLSFEPLVAVGALPKLWLWKGCLSVRLREFSCLSTSLAAAGASAALAVFPEFISSDGETDCSGKAASELRGAAWMLLNLLALVTGLRSGRTGAAAVNLALRAARTHRPVAISLIMFARALSLLTAVDLEKLSAFRVQNKIASKPIVSLRKVPRTQRPTAVRSNVDTFVHSGNLATKFIYSGH